MALGTLAVGMPATPILAQINANPTIPPSSTEDDVDEVEEIAPDSAYLPAQDEAKGAAPVRDDPLARRDAEHVAGIKDAQDAELQPSMEEVRARYDLGLALGVGSNRPWESYSLEAFGLYTPNLEAGLFAGGGNYSSSGIVAEKGYELRLNTRSAGVTVRYHLSHLERLSFEALLGYAAWEGRIAPHGSDDQLQDAADKLTSSFRANGVFVGVSAALDWVWENGVFLQWTPVGFRRSRILQRDLSHDSVLTGRALATTIERPGFYGLTSLKLGYLF